MLLSNRRSFANHLTYTAFTAFFGYQTYSQVQNGTWSQEQWATGLGAVFATLVALFIYFRSMKKRELYGPFWRSMPYERVFTLDLFRTPLLVTLVAGTLAARVFTLPDLMLSILAWAVSASNRYLALALAVPWALVIGGTLFWFRLRKRFYYGVSEIAAGACIAFAQVDQFGFTAIASNQALLLAFLTASAYLIVRGLDNAHQGMIAKDAPPFVREFNKAWLEMLKRFKE